MAAAAKRWNKKRRAYRIDCRNLSGKALGTLYVAEGVWNGVEAVNGGESCTLVKNVFDVMRLQSAEIKSSVNSMISASFSESQRDDLYRLFLALQAARSGQEATPAEALAPFYTVTLGSGEASQSFTVCGNGIISGEHFFADASVYAKVDELYQEKVYGQI